MERDAVHELTAAYVLDALDESDERDYEDHLRHCERCRSDVVGLRETAAALAYAAPAPAPRPELRERILDAARAERPNVVPLRPRVSWRPLAAVAAVAACAAIGLGVWAGLLASSLDDKNAQLQAYADVLGDPAARRISVQGADGTLVVARRGEAVLVLGLRDAPSGKTYEAWVISGKTPRPAGTFDSGGPVRLTRPVPPGATVAVTLEPHGGSKAPTTKPFAAARA